MKKITTIILMMCAMNVFAQNVNIPDANFKNYLVNNTAINTNGDTEIQCSEATAFTGTIQANGLSIADFTGLEAFVNITSLHAYNNSLTSINVSSNTALTYFDCSNTGISTLDVSNNVALTGLFCHFNSLTDLDLSTNTALNSVYCYDNLLVNIDLGANTTITSLRIQNNLLTDLSISANTAMNYLNCSNNNLSTLNLANGNNTNFTVLNALNNSNLSCIQVDDVTWSNNNWGGAKDPTASFSTSCSLNSENFSNENLFVIFPNPVVDNLYIKNTVNKSIEYIRVLDITGKVVLEQVNAVESISLSALKQGFYLVLITSEGKITSQKIIKE